jgi:hypothetical protein
VRVDWRELRLAQSVAEGYGEAAPEIDELVRDAVASRPDRLPTVVWIYDVEDEKENRLLETRVFQDLKVGVALKRFACLKGNIATIPDEAVAERLRRRSPIFLFYDPAGEPFARLEGKRATSRSGFYRVVEKLWRTSFELKLRSFTGRMTKILDRIDRLEKEKQLLAAKKSRAEGNPRKLRGIVREEDELEEEERAVLEDEEELLADCRLRKEFVSGNPEAAGR